jgi:hypothetical protein
MRIADYAYKIVEKYKQKGGFDKSDWNWRYA